MKYQMGKKLDRYEKLLIFVSAVVVYGFCYIYNYVFQMKGFAVPVSLLVLVFTLLELLVAVLINKTIQIYRQSTYYVLDSKGITCYGYRMKDYYRWTDFEEARFDYARIIGMRHLPVIFIAGGKRLRISRYVDRFNELSMKILEHIPDVVDEDLKDKLLTYK